MARVQANGKDGFPARVYRSFAVSGLTGMLARRRALRGDNLDEEELDVLALSPRGELKTESPRPVEQILEEILVELREIKEAFNGVRL